MAPLVTIVNHTTASDPRPHILYTIQATVDDKELVTQRRYSEFVSLHETLKDPFNLPPKRLLVTTFIPSAWVDDALISERKAGLAEYLTDILSSTKYKNQSSVYEFLASHDPERDSQAFDLEDAVPSTLSRNVAMSIAASLKDDEVTTKANALLACGYYPDWAASRFPPEGLNYSKWDILFFAFVSPNEKSTLTFNSGDTSIIRRLVASAKDSGYGTKIVLSVGGWGGCYYFSQACSTAANRTKFVNALVSAVNTYNLDGVDLDWASHQGEYPNSPGAGQPYSPKDSANFLSFVQLLRSALGPCKIISAAVPHLPWLGADGKALKNVSEYAALFTYVNIMNYDVWGASATPGPNAPIGDLCGTSRQPSASAEGAFKAWTLAGFPPSKLLLGLALYGYVSKSTKNVLTGSSVPTEGMLLLQKEEKPSIEQEGQKNGTVELPTKSETKFLNGAHARNPIPASDEVNSTATANLTSYWGKQIAFVDIVKSGALVKKSDGNYGQAGGFTMGWDNCSNTPYLFNTAQQTVVTYDDTWSLTDKAKLAKKQNMAGVFTWSIDQDDGLTLQNAIRKGLGR